MKKRKICVASCILVIGAVLGIIPIAQGQQTNDQFRVINRRITVDQGSGVVNLNQVDGSGIAWIKGRRFTQGIIEFDVKGKDEFQGSFLGIAFHGVNDSTYECIYFRPFNFRAADRVRKSHALQYIALPGFDWPKLRVDFPDKYEGAVSETIDPNQWFHVKIEVMKGYVCVFVNRNITPVLEVEALTKTSGKMIGYWVGTGSGGDWKNLKITSGRHRSL